LVHVTGRDWGWYTTFMQNLARLMPAEVPSPAAAQIGARVVTIQKALVDAPKSLSWKTRAAVGRRMAWYELPEEIGGG
jgi:hypothetical protein